MCTYLGEQERMVTRACIYLNMCKVEVFETPGITSSEGLSPMCTYLGAQERMVTRACTHLNIYKMRCLKPQVQTLLRGSRRCARTWERRSAW